MKTNQKKLGALLVLGAALGGFAVLPTAQTNCFAADSASLAGSNHVSLMEEKNPETSLKTLGGLSFQSSFQETVSNFFQTAEKQCTKENSPVVQGVQTEKGADPLTLPVANQSEEIKKEELLPVSPKAEATSSSAVVNQEEVKIPPEALIPAKPQPVKPKVAPQPRPKINARIPADFKVDAQGRRVCGKKNDKPSKSDKNKKVHMDMECCLDPDETPNPHCYYPVEKYGKYLNKPPK